MRAHRRVTGYEFVESGREIQKEEKKKGRKGRKEKRREKYW